MPEIQYRLCTWSPDDAPDLHTVMTMKTLEGVDYYMDVVASSHDRDEAVGMLKQYRHQAPSEKRT
jgi:hypothetical protein